MLQKLPNAIYLIIERFWRFVKGRGRIWRFKNGYVKRIDLKNPDDIIY